MPTMHNGPEIRAEADQLNRQGQEGLPEPQMLVKDVQGKKAEKGGKEDAQNYRQDEKARVVSHLPQSLGALGCAPTNELVAGRALPGGGSKEQARQILPCGALDQILQILAHHAQPQIMVPP